jgi:hypothetical protein
MGNHPTKKEIKIHEEQIGYAKQDYRDAERVFEQFQYNNKNPADEDKYFIEYRRLQTIVNLKMLEWRIAVFEHKY